MNIIIYIFGITAILLTLLPLIPSKIWFIRILDFPRLQITFLLIISLAAALIFLNKKHTETWLFILLLTGSVIFSQL